MPNPVAAGVVLDDDERAQLERWTRRRTSARALAQRARIVLLAAGGLKNTEIAAELGITRGMAAKWRARFVEHRLDGLTDEPRPGRPRTVTDDKVEEVIVKTLETTPKEATHWSTRARWPRRCACRSRRSRGSGGRSGCSPTAKRCASCPRTRCY